MAIDFPDASESPFFDGNGQEWQHNGDAWIRIYEDPIYGIEDRYTDGIKSLIINGDFNIWQRTGGAVTQGDGYNADRWRTRVINNSTVTTALEVISLTEGKNIDYRYGSCIVNISNLNSSIDEAITLQQHIYGVRHFAGKTVTLSFLAKTSSGAGYKVGTEIVQQFGTGGSAAVTNILTKSFELSSEFTIYTVTGTIPDIDNKIIGNQSSLRVNFWISAGSDYASRSSNIGHQQFAFHITGVQLEQGENATKMAMFDWNTEVSECQRYYCKSYNIGVPPGNVDSKEGAITHMQSKSDTVLWGSSVQFPVSMRKTPIVDVYSAKTGTKGKVNIAGGADYTASVPLVGQSGIDYVQTTSPVPADSPIVFHYTADADFY